MCGWRVLLCHGEAPSVRLVIISVISLLRTDSASGLYPRRLRRLLPPLGTRENDTCAILYLFVFSRNKFTAGNDRLTLFQR